MKLNILYIILATAAVLTACSQEDEPQLPGRPVVSITVTDCGFASPGRVEDNAYTTSFAAGDRCGLYIVRNGKMMAENILLTASDRDGAIVWEPDKPLLGGLDGESYYLYYPYQSNMAGKVSVSASGDLDFFEPLISAWEPVQDQSNYRWGYVPSDLMTAEGKSRKSPDGSLQLSFGMTHRMALAVIDMPQATFKYTDSSFPDYTGRVAAIFADEGPQPYIMPDGTYRFIVNPSKDTSISASYFSGLKEFTVTCSGIARGSYKTFKVEPNTTLQRSYTMQPGDYFCQKADRSWYLIPYEALPDANATGVVFYKGLHPTDKRELYSVPLSPGGPTLQQTVHGYVLSMNSLGNYAWSTEDIKYGTSTSTTDWNGYSNCRVIRTYVTTNTEGKTMDDFPAFKVCENYTETSPQRTSGWFLPAVAQLCTAWQSFSNNDAVARAVKTAGGDKLPVKTYEQFWSSTESGNQFFGEWEASLLSCYSGRVSTARKYGALPVRPILAF